MHILEKKRIDWIDIMKGIGIFLVVIGHAPRDIMMEECNPIKIIYQFIYCFHMELFFFAAGCTSLYSRIGKFAIWMKKRIKSLLVPWLAYTILLYIGFSIIYLIPAGSVNSIINDGYLNPVSYFQLALRGENPYASHLWFILVLLMMQVLLYIAFAFSDHLRMERKNILLLCWLVSIVLFFFWHPTIMVWKMLRKNLMYYILGRLYIEIKGDNSENLEGKERNGLILFSVGAISFLVYVFAYEQGYIQNELLIDIVKAEKFLIGGPCLIFGIRILIMHIQGIIKRVLIFLGRNSFNIYLLHQPICCSLLGGVLVTVLPALVPAYVLIMAACVISSIFIPLIVLMVFDGTVIGHILNRFFNLRLVKDSES